MAATLTPEEHLDLTISVSKIISNQEYYNSYPNYLGVDQKTAASRAGELASIYKDAVRKGDSAESVNLRDTTRHPPLEVLAVMGLESEKARNAARKAAMWIIGAVLFVVGGIAIWQYTRSRTSGRRR